MITLQKIPIIVFMAWPLNLWPSLSSLPRLPLGSRNSVSSTHYFCPIVHPPAFWVCELMTLPSIQSSKQEMSSISLAQSVTSRQSCLRNISLLISPRFPLPYTNAHYPPSQLSNELSHRSISKMPLLHIIPKPPPKFIKKTNVGVSLWEDE